MKGTGIRGLGAAPLPSRWGRNVSEPDVPRPLAWLDLATELLALLMTAAELQKTAC